MSKLTEVLKRENWYLKIRYILTIKKQKYEMIAGWVVVNAILYPERYQKLIIRPQNGKKLPIQAFYEVLDNVGVRRLWYPVAQNDEVERWRLGYEDCQTLLWSEYHQRIYSYEYADDDYKPMLGSTFKC